MTGQDETPEALKPIINELRKVIEFELTFEGVLLPTFVLIGEKDGEKRKFIFQTEFETESSKDHAVSVVRMMAIAYKVEQVSFASECWITKVDKDELGHLTEDEVLERYNRGELDKYKIEGVNIYTEDKTHTCSNHLIMRRNSDGTFRELEEEEPFVAPRTDGRSRHQRFAEFLPPPQIEAKITDELRDSARKNIESAMTIQTCGLDEDIADVIYANATKN